MLSGYPLFRRFTVSLPTPQGCLTAAEASTRLSVFRGSVTHRHTTATMHNASISVETLRAELQRLCKAIKSYADTMPTVSGTQRLLKRAQRDHAFVEALEHQHHSAGAAKSNKGVPGSRASAELQGVYNNLRGLQAELDVAWQAEAVVCVGAKFYSQVSAGRTCAVPALVALNKPFAGVTLMLSTQ